MLGEFEVLSVSQDVEIPNSIKNEKILIVHLLCDLECDMKMFSFENKIRQIKLDCPIWVHGG